MIWLLVFGWAALAIPVAVVIGKGIKLADRRA